MDTIDVVRHKNKTIIRGDALLFGFLNVYVTVGTIEYSKRYAQYFFYNNMFVDCVSGRIIKVINKEIKRLEYKQKFMVNLGGITLGF